MYNNMVIKNNTMFIDRIFYKYSKSSSYKLLMINAKNIETDEDLREAEKHDDCVRPYKLTVFVEDKSTKYKIFNALNAEQYILIFVVC